MKKTIKKGFALFLTVLLIVTMWTVPVYAEGSIDVIFSGVNAILKEGTTGENAASADEDYSLTVEFEDGCSLGYITVFGYGNNDGKVLDYDYDEATGVITVTKEHMAEYEGTLYEIEIQVIATTEFNPENDIIDVSSLPYVDEYELSEDLAKLIGFEDSVDVGIMRFYQVELEEGQELYYKAIGTDDVYTDLRLYVAKYIENNRFEALDYTDGDNLGMGEIGLFGPSEAGKYIFILVTDDVYIGENVKFELIDIASFEDNLDFTETTVPTPDADDLWDWNTATKTLTLKDGFDILTESCAVVLPDGATVNVEGNASICSFTEDAICGGGDLTINLAKGATLDIEAGYGCIYTPAGKIIVQGEADADGNLPVLKSEASYNGFLIDDDGHNTAIDGKTNAVIINNVKLDMTGVGGIAVFKGEVTIEDSEVTADTKNECVYVDYYDTEPGEDYDIVIVNSVLDLTSEDEAIQNYIGGVTITGCDTKLCSKEQEGIDATGNVNIEGGRINITSEKNNILADGHYLYLTDVNFYLHNNSVYGEYDIIEAYTNGAWGEFIVYDQNMNIIHDGEMTDEMIRMFEEEGMFTFSDENGEHIYPKLVVSTFDGKAENNVVEGVLNQYEEGQNLEFTADSEGMDIKYPVWAFERFKARKWEIVGTNLSGIVEEEGNTIDISTLEAGTYTLRVRFEKQVFMRDYWTYYGNAGDDKIDYVDVEFEVLGANQEITPPPTDDDPTDDDPPADESPEQDDDPPADESPEQDDNPPADDNPPVDETPEQGDNSDEGDKEEAPDTGAGSAGFVYVIVALVGVMTLSVKKTKKASK